MRIEPATIPGAWVVTPQIHPDERGWFFEWFRSDVFEATTGRAFAVRQSNQSVSRRGVVRGIHYADVPPGQAKWVYCPSGRILDVVVDLRVGSPTFGRSEGVELGGDEQRSVVIAEGLGHGFCALSEDAVVSYLLTDTYRPGAEHGVSPLDPDLAVDWGLATSELVLSDKDATAPTLAEALAAGALPQWSSPEVRAAAGQSADQLPI